MVTPCPGNQVHRTRCAVLSGCRNCALQCESFTLVLASDVYVTLEERQKDASYMVDCFAVSVHFPPAKTTRKEIFVYRSHVSCEAPPRTCERISSNRALARAC
jgi:hypothetical protein